MKARTATRFFQHDWMQLDDILAGIALQDNDALARKRVLDGIALRAWAESIESGGSPPSIRLELV